MNDVTNKAAIDGEKVKSCWSKIKSAKGTDFFIDNFYQLIFDQHPHVHALFPKNMDEQKAKLLTTLDNVINGIDYIDELKPSFTELGLYHKNINITEEMYDVVISTIVETAKASTHNKLTHEELRAWAGAFREISNIMLEAYDS